ncbi:hypothetical protein SGPA1_11627 [Streptomyces misionensis JCM 4497]
MTVAPPKVQAVVAPVAVPANLSGSDDRWGGTFLAPSLLPWETTDR